ncbi:camp protein kinase regulatory chain [Chrysochromulina tobinii]|uniref:Camp protein kinase regulatory chain n=1 Tax=Chrysochromulina tobinii TaxID=1460289 RepID=A0A0M0J756_9EUKA|nr:camp protein kinase regulatory chain [Chrysochromulina tobinii]|eukprot:KOO22053.1 camp protein kinase regulatory chain [Chrysochromulina sp. CCMP291]
MVASGSGSGSGYANYTALEIDTVFNMGVACGWGLVSALSLIIGAAIGIVAKPGPMVTSGMMAFGGGALIEALTIELFGAIMHHQEEDGIGGTLIAIAAAVFGGVFFSALNKVLNDQGAFMRKRSTLKHGMMSAINRTKVALIDRLKIVPMFHHLPTSDLKKLTHQMRRKVYRKTGSVVFSYADQHDGVNDHHAVIFFVLRGSVRVTMYQDEDTDPSATAADTRPREDFYLSKDRIFGDVGLLSGIAAACEVTTSSPNTKDSEVSKGDVLFEAIDDKSPMVLILLGIVDLKLNATTSSAFRANDILGLHHYIYGQELRVEAVVRVPSTILTIARADLDRLTAKHQPLKEAVALYRASTSPDPAASDQCLHGYPSLADYGWKAEPEVEAPRSDAGWIKLMARGAIQTSKQARILGQFMPFATGADLPPTETQKLYRHIANLLDDLQLHSDETQGLRSRENLEEQLHEHVEDAHGNGGNGKNAAIMIWLGIGLDGIPESFVLGILANAGDMPSLITFVVGVFLANLPEAMSSSAIMSSYGMKSRVIMLMWTAIFIGTGIGAGLGALAFPPVGPEGRSDGIKMTIAGIEGMCGGAMLTMIASTVLPEAFEHGGSMIGVACLFGFLAALLTKAIGSELSSD